MNIWTELARSELGLFAVLLALGAGPASLLSARFDAASRIALAPILGFCFGTCITTTLLQFFPAGETWGVLVAAMAISCLYAVRRTLDAPSFAWPPLRDLAQLAVVCVAITAPLTLVLYDHHTVGPASYYFTDVDNYVGTQQAAATTSLADARQEWIDESRSDGRFANLTDRAYAFLAWFGSNLDAMPLHANVNALLGERAVDTFAPFQIILLLMGGLGAFAAVRYITQRPTWAAPLAGTLFGGPLFLELWFDSFQAAIIALALIAPAVVLGADALREARRASLVLLALVMACFLSVYPLFIPPLVAIGAAGALWQAVARRRSGAGVRELWRSLGLPALAVAVMTLVFNPVAVARSVVYYDRLVNGGVPLPRVAFSLPPEVLPGWLLQTREFWFLLPLDLGSFKDLALALIIPFAFLGFVAAAVRRHRIAVGMVGFGALVGLMAYAAYASQDRCTYCGERYLLALAPVLIVLLGVGLSHALGAPSRVWKAVGIGGVVLVVAAVGERTRVELDRFADVSFFYDTATRHALEDLPADGRPVHVEGFWASTGAQAEQALTYHLVSERAPDRVSVSLGTNYSNALSYLNFGTVLSPGPEFRPDYRYLLTRFSGVATGRRLVVRRGAIGLMERTQPLDVTPYAGLTMPQARIDGSGVPWVNAVEPLGLYVVGTTSEDVWARLTFATTERVKLPRQRGVRARSRATKLTICARAGGTSPVRNIGLQIPASAPGAVRLTEMRAVTGRCKV